MVRRPILSEIRRVLLTSQFDNTGSPGIVLLESTGVINSRFDARDGANGPIFAVAVQADGKILVVGDFSQFDGEVRGNVARLNMDGSLDSTFDPGVGVNGPVFAVALCSDRDVLIGGDFSQFNGID